MKIDFNKIDETMIPAFKGGEKETAAKTASRYRRNRSGVQFDSSKTARTITKADYARFDRIICMDRSNLRWLSRIIGDDPEKYCAEVSAALGKPVGRGVFGADMQVSLINDGPVTIIIDSRIKE